MSGVAWGAELLLGQKIKKFKKRAEDEPEMEKLVGYIVRRNDEGGVKQCLVCRQVFLDDFLFQV